MFRDKEKLKNEFISKSIEKFGDKFDYSKVDYVDCKTPIILICRKHGEFITTPDRHLRYKSGCPWCNRRKQSKGEEMTYKEFIEKANEKYDNKFEYKCDNWIGVVKSKVTVICPEHGESIVNARSHISNMTKFGCPICGNIERAKSKTDSYDDVIKQFMEVYGNFYIYPEINRETYKNKKSKIKIICPEHGEFIKTPSKHLSGQGCHKCRMEELIKTNQLPGGYCEDLFLTKPELKNTSALLYYFSINNGKFFKIGITTKNTSKNRIQALKTKAKSFGINIDIDEVCSKTYTLYEAFKIEQYILETYTEQRIFTKWSTELFKENIYESISKYFV